MLGRSIEYSEMQCDAFEIPPLPSCTNGVDGFNVHLALLFIELEQDHLGRPIVEVKSLNIVGVPIIDMRPDNPSTFSKPIFM